MQLWRLVKTKYSATAFDGEGARLYGGRWNSAGVRVAYAADSSALAVLEVLAHLRNKAVLRAYSLVRARFPDQFVEDIDESILPADWNTSPVPPSVQAVGDEWIRSGRSAALKAPSAIVQGGYSILINPDHPHFAKFIVEASTPFSFDPRLL